MSSKIAVKAFRKVGLKKKPKDEQPEQSGPILTALDPTAIQARRRKTQAPAAPNFLFDTLGG